MDRRDLATRRSSRDAAARARTGPPRRPGRLCQQDRHRPGEPCRHLPRTVRGDPSLRRRERPRRARPHRVAARSSPLTRDAPAGQHAHRRGRRGLQRGAGALPPRRSRAVGAVVRRGRVGRGSHATGAGRRRAGAAPPVGGAAVSTKGERTATSEQRRRVACARSAPAVPRPHRAGRRCRARHSVEISECGPRATSPPRAFWSNTGRCSQTGRVARAGSSRAPSCSGSPGPTHFGDEGHGSTKSSQGGRNRRSRTQVKPLRTHLGRPLTSSKAPSRSSSW